MLIYLLYFFSKDKDLSNIKIRETNKKLILSEEWFNQYREYDYIVYKYRVGFIQKDSDIDKLCDSLEEWFSNYGTQEYNNSIDSEYAYFDKEYFRVSIELDNTKFIKRHIQQTLNQLSTNESLSDFVENERYEICNVEIVNKQKKVIAYGKLLLKHLKIKQNIDTNYDLNVDLSNDELEDFYL